MSFDANAAVWLLVGLLAIAAVPAFSTALL